MKNNQLNFFLGVYKEGESKYTLHEDYVSETYSYGTKCDINGKPRQVEVRYRCAKDTNQITLWKEPSICNYVIYFDTKYLCAHPAYKPLGDQVNKVPCFEGPLNTLEELSDLIEKKRKENPQPYPPVIESSTPLSDEQPSEEDDSDSPAIEIYTLEELIKKLKEEDISEIEIDSSSIDYDKDLNPDETKDDLINLFKTQLKDIIQKMQNEINEEETEEDQDPPSQKKVNWF